jgi:hypothetical protein
LVSKGGGGRPLWTGKWKWVAAWVREKKGAEGEMAGGLSSFCFSGFGRERESGSSLALSRSLLAKGRGRDRLVLVKIGLGSLSFPFFFFNLHLFCMRWKLLFIRKNIAKFQNLVPQFYFIFVNLISFIFLDFFL